MPSEWYKNLMMVIYIQNNKINDSKCTRIDAERGSLNNCINSDTNNSGSQTHQISYSSAQHMNKLYVLVCRS